MLLLYPISPSRLTPSLFIGIRAMHIELPRKLFQMVLTLQFCTQDQDLKSHICMHRANNTGPHMFWLDVNILLILVFPLLLIADMFTAARTMIPSVLSSIIWQRKKTQCALMLVTNLWLFLPIQPWVLKHVHWGYNSITGVLASYRN